MKSSTAFIRQMFKKYAKYLIIIDLKTRLEQSIQFLCRWSFLNIYG